MTIKIVTVLLAILFLASVAASDESLVISTLINRKGDWSVVELLACTSIADLSRYSFKQYNGDKISPINNYIWDFVSVPAGARVYASSLSDTRFKKFFGFAPQYFSYSSEHVRFNGSSNVQLVYEGSTVIDTYGVVGQNISAAADFTDGWAARKLGRQVAFTFNVSDWSVRFGALSSNPSNNSYANPPIQIKTFLCPSRKKLAASQRRLFQAPSQRPTPSPTLKESFAISTIVNHPSWNAVELTACTDIADLSLYSLKLYGWDIWGPLSTPTFIYNWNLLAIPAGSRVYVSSASKTDFQIFFGYIPEYFFLARGVLRFGGNWRIQLVYDGSRVVDVYGNVGQKGGNDYRFDKGWVGHRSGKNATMAFNPADWNLHYLALDPTPLNNSDATPPVEFERYQCPGPVMVPTAYPTMPPTNSPSTQPTRRPANATSRELLLMTTLVDHLGDWCVLELLACSKIANLSLYSFKQYKGYNGASSHTYNWNRSKSLPMGSRVYVSSMSASDFKAFFGFQPKYFFPSVSDVLFTGASKVQLVYNGSMVVDSYDSSHGNSGDFTKGWVGRNKAGKAVTAKFNLSDWDLHDLSFHLNPLKNSQAFPPVQFGKYKCTRTETTTLPPTTHTAVPSSHDMVRQRIRSHTQGA